MRSILPKEISGPLSGMTVRIWTFRDKFELTLQQGHHVLDFGRDLPFLPVAARQRNAAFAHHLQEFAIPGRTDAVDCVPGRDLATGIRLQVICGRDQFPHSGPPLGSIFMQRPCSIAQVPRRVIRRTG